MLPPSSNCANIRAWAEDLGQERVRLANHLREQLRRYYPQALEVSDDVASEWFLALWKKAPTPEKARRIRTNTVAKLLKTHRIRKIDAPEVLRLLRQKPLTVAPGTIAAACAHIGSLAERLRLVNRQVKQARSRIDGLCRHIADQQDSASGQKSEQRDVDILLSMPGIGRTVLATLLAEASTPLRERNYQALRTLSGAAPVTRRSGKRCLVIMRQACHVRLRTALYHWARVAIQHDPISRQRYAALRARGHGHARALRTVADRLLAVACAMLRNQTLFDPSHAQKKGDIILDVPQGHC